MKKLDCFQLSDNTIFHIIPCALNCSFILSMIRTWNQYFSFSLFEKTHTFHWTVINCTQIVYCDATATFKVNTENIVYFTVCSLIVNLLHVYLAPFHLDIPFLILLDQKSWITARRPSGEAIFWGSKGCNNSVFPLGKANIYQLERR